MALPRSYLYVPGNRPQLFDKAEAGEADALILDLEDAVPGGEKAAARSAVAEWLGRRAGGKPAWVRLNPGPMVQDDIEAVGRAPGVAGFVLAKAASAAAVAEVVSVLRRLGSSAPVSPLLETPAAVLDAREIAAVDGVAFLQLGEYDLAAEVGLEPDPSGQQLLFARSLVVFASAAAGLTPPVAPVSVLIDDEAGFERSTRDLVRLGFLGRACIHPRQVGIVNAVCTPTAEAVAAARSEIERLGRAVAAGTGVLVDDEGRMVDEAVIRRARRILQLAEGRVVPAPTGDPG